MTQKVTQVQSAISVVEKEAATLDCVYETSGYGYYLKITPARHQFWFPPGPRASSVLSPSGPRRCIRFWFPPGPCASSVLVRSGPQCVVGSLSFWAPGAVVSTVRFLHL